MPPALTSTVFPARVSVSPSSSRTRAKIASGSLIRPRPISPSASSPSSGPISSHPALAQRRDVRLRGRVLPHADVHRRRDQKRPAEGERELREHVVRQPVRQLRERVRGQRRDHQQVGVDQVRVELVRLLAPGERLERPRRDEALGLGGQDRRHLVPRLDEESAELARLVGGDAAGHSEEDPPGHVQRPSSCTCT